MAGPSSIPDPATTPDFSNNKRGMTFFDILATVVGTGIALILLISIIKQCCAQLPSPNAWKYRNNYRSVRRRVREGYGSERAQLRDKKYMARRGWTVDVEMGSSRESSGVPKPPAPARTAGRMSSETGNTTFEGREPRPYARVSPNVGVRNFSTAREPRPYAIPTPGMTRVTANVPGSIPTSSATASETTRTNWSGMPTAFTPRTAEGAGARPFRTMSLQQMRTEAEVVEAAPAYDTLRDTVSVTVPPPAYSANPRDGEVVAEGREEGDDWLGWVREEGHREGTDHQGRRGVWVTTFHAES